MTPKEYAELLKEIHQADEKIYKANSKLIIWLIIRWILFVLFVIWVKNWWFK
jgi:hypothetical protein